MKKIKTIWKIGLFILALAFGLCTGGCGAEKADISEKTQKADLPGSFAASGAGEMDSEANKNSDPAKGLYPGYGETEMPDGTGGAAGAKTQQFIQKNGMTLESRFAVPEGFVRTKASEGSLLQFMRQMKLKPDGSPVLLYDGSVKANQGSAAAVFDLDIGGENLQQCADSVLRIYAEYFWATGQQDRLKFHLTSGFLTDWETWKNGGRLAVSGSDVSWQQTAGPDDSYENFRKYFRNVIIYAGTISLDAESEPIQADEIKAGNLWVQGGSPGHCVLVVDTADFVGDRGDRNEGGEDGCGDSGKAGGTGNMPGRRAFLLAQGYMPAQDFHVLNNPAHPEDPWYYADEIEYPFRTAEYTFREGTLQRWNGGFAE